MRRVCFFLHIFFSFYTSSSPPPHALSLSFYLSFSLLSIWSSPRYFLERPHFNDAMYSTCCRLRALSSIIFADLNMNNAAAAAERAVLYKIMQFFSASQPFLFFFSVFFFFVVGLFCFCAFRSIERPSCDAFTVCALNCHVSKSYFISANKLYTRAAHNGMVSNTIKTRCVFHVGIRKDATNSFIFFLRSLLYNNAFVHFFLDVSCKQFKQAILVLVVAKTPTTSHA